MMDLLLEKNDLKIHNGDFALCATDTEAIAQSLSMRLKTIAQEWFLDTNLGIPYLTHIFGQKLNQRFLQQLIMPTIENAIGIAAIKDFHVTEKTNRTVEITFVALLHNEERIAINETIGLTNA